MKKSSNVGGGAQGAAAMNGAAAKNAATDDMNVKEFYSLEFGRMRTMTDKNGEPFFCGKDVCDALGYKRAYDAIRQHVNHGDTAKRSITKTVKNQYGESSKIKKVEMLFVNESGVYSLVFGSKLESAQRFKHWVTSEVLPAIRKNGGYFHINPDETPEQIKARFQKVLEEAIAERDKVIVSLEKDVDRMLPKELYVDNVLDSIHSGNTAKDTQGCILLGENRKVGMVVNSRIWMHRFMQKFVEARDRGEAVFIAIDNGGNQFFSYCILHAQINSQL